MLFSLGQQPGGKVHHHQNGGDENGVAQQVVAPKVFKNQKGIALLGEHEEHEVGVQGQVHPVDGDGHGQQHEQAPGDVLGLGFDIPTGGEKDGVSHQENVDGKAVPVHEVPQGQGRPGGKEQGGGGRRDAHGVEIVSQALAGLPGVEGDEEDIDGAQVEWEVFRDPPTAQEEHSVLEDLIRHQEAGDDPAPPLTANLAASAVEKTAHQAEQDKDAQPNEME